jgi:hypothetical protein
VADANEEYNSQVAVPVCDTQGRVIMSASRRKGQMLGIACGLCLVSQIALAHGFVTVHVKSAEEIVSAMLEANRLDQGTIIRVAPGNYSFTTIFATEAGSSALPAVTTTIRVIGAGADKTTFNGRVFVVSSTGALLVRGITLTRGSSSCDDAASCAKNGGGAASNAGGVLWLDQCAVTQSFVGQTDGERSLDGGGIKSGGGYLYVSDTTVRENSASWQGGGISITGGAALIRDSIISANTVDVGIGSGGNVLGGGVFVSGGAKVRVVRSTVSGNFANANVDEWAGFGIGVFNSDSTVWLTRSAVTENSMADVGSGGGIYNDAGTIHIEDSTVGGNSAGTLGGGIFNSGTLTMKGTTVARNEVQGGGFPGPSFGMRSYPPGCDGIKAPELCFSTGGGIWNEPAAVARTQGSIIALNTKRKEVEFVGSDCAGTVVSDGHNAMGTTEECQIHRSRQMRHSGEVDQLNLDPRLGELNDDAEPGEAHFPLLPDSPLIDKGGRVHKDCTVRDQLGRRRADGDGDALAECDVGAIEFRAAR